MTNKIPARDLKITQDQQRFLAQHTKVWKRYSREDVKAKADYMLDIPQMLVGQAVPRAIREEIATIIALSFQAGYEQKERECAGDTYKTYEFTVEENDDK